MNSLLMRRIVCTIIHPTIQPRKLRQMAHLYYLEYYKTDHHIATAQRPPSQPTTALAFSDREQFPQGPKSYFFKPANYSDLSVR